MTFHENKVKEERKDGNAVLQKDIFFQMDLQNLHTILLEGRVLL